MASLDLDVRTSGNLAVSDETTIGMVADDRNSKDALLDWADEPEETTSLVLSAPREYRVASSRGTGAGSTVRATLTDQYGAPVVRQQIWFTSSDREGVPRGVRRTTDSMGVATLHYQRDSEVGSIERVTGRFEKLVGTVRQFWAAQVPSPAEDSGEVRLVETDNDRVIVVAGDDVWLIEYDANDHFNIGTETASFAAFEKALSEGDTLAYETAASTTGVNTFTLTDRG